jgi:hypothetical protein
MPLLLLNVRQPRVVEQTCRTIPLFHSYLAASKTYLHSRSQCSHKHQLTSPLLRQHAQMANKGHQRQPMWLNNVFYASSPYF